jgi:hypothetical protein
LNVWAQSVGQDMDSFAWSVLHEVDCEVLKVAIERIGLVQEFGLLGHKGLKTEEKLPTVTPFEADPALRKALLESIVKQKAEKVKSDAAKGSDASRV